MIQYFSIEEATHQISDSIESMKKVVPFIKENKLLSSIKNHKWISIITLIASILITYILICNCIDYFSSSPLKNEAINLEIDDKINEEQISRLKDTSKTLLLTGGWKYLFLIVFELVIFFFATQTLAILKGIKINPTLKQFIKAEKRMIKVMVRNFIQALIIGIVVHIVLSIASQKQYTGIIMFFVHAYYIGFAFMDNYNEQFEIEIKESQKIVLKHGYASTFLGVVISLLLYIPLLGPLITPLFGAITATLYGHKNAIEVVNIEKAV